MSSDASNDFFWQDIQASDSNSDLQLQRISLDSFVSPDQSQVQVQLQPEESNSPPTMVSTSGENMNNNNSPSTPQQPILPPGVINPDAIIPQSRSYTCRICQVTFPNKSAVTVHSRIHTNHEGKPYRCGFCNKGFSTNFYLKQHERIHNGQKPYKCPMCDHSFKQLSHVQQHVRTHTGVRPYKCHWPGCGKAFLQQSHLKSHIARHSPKPNNGVRPYKCHWPDCGKSFAQISNLKSHIARHTPKPQKQRKESTEQKPTPTTIEQPIAEMPSKLEVEEPVDGSFLLPPDVIGQAAAAANIVPVQVPLGDYESICPFLCPGCSKLYVREATFKKHLEECKTKLQMSISATAAALGIEPPPLPPPTTQFGSNEMSAMPVDIALAAVEDPASSESPAKKSRKSQKPRQTKINNQQPFMDHSQQPGPIIVEMPLDVGLGNCSPQMSDGSLSDGNVKSEVLSLPIDATSSGNVMFKLPPHILSAVGGNSNDDSNSVSGTNVNSFFSSISYNPSVSQLMDNTIFNNQQMVTSSPISLPIVASQPLSSSQSVMLSGASADEHEKQNSSTKVESSNMGHSTINQAALRWQWDQPPPRMNFP